MARLIPPEVKATYFLLRQQGHTQVEAAKQAGISYGSARHLEARATGVDRPSFRADQARPPLKRRDLSKQALKSLNDIGYFAWRYYGLVLMPFHYQDTERIVELLATPDKEFVCINIAPGTGKTTFYTRVIPAWLTCRDRTIRGLLGSATHNLATRYTRALRSDFVRNLPIKNSHDDIERGIAKDAISTLAHDFGVFRPSASDESKWTQDMFVVAQVDDQTVAQKEYTWQAFGKDTSVIGTRVKFAVWDDLYDPARTKTPDARADLYNWWSNTAEARLEPGGMLLLVGQRLDPDDIYHYALQQRRLDEHDNPVPKYHHVIHPAHHDDICEGIHHGPKVQPWPKGCLLYPGRLTWRDLSTERLNRPDVYEITYQQRDYYAQNVLVQRLWVDGGIDPNTGESFIGCWDDNRDLCEYPRGLTPPLYSFASADPSPSKYWAIGWWLYHPASQQRFLLDLHRARMDAPDLLDWDHNNQQFVGLMDNWQARSVRLGVPISHWIIEVNAAQKFLIQTDTVRRWRMLNRVNVVPHTTGIMKTDAELGVPAMKSIWRNGLVRLPGATYDSRRTVQPLVDEACRYNTAGKQVGTDDCVMQQWFFEFNLPKLSNRGLKIARQVRPTWAAQFARHMRG